MFALSRRAGFTLRDLLVVVFLIGVALALLGPRMNGSRINTYRNHCVNNMRQLGLALQNYHDVYRKFPTIAGTCDNLLEQQLGYGSGANHDCTSAQYSWIVRILPYIEEGNLYNEISLDSNKFKISPFDRSLRVGDNRNPSNLHFSQVDIPSLLCPA